MNNKKNVKIISYVLIISLIIGATMVFSGCEKNEPVFKRSSSASKDKDNDKEETTGSDICIIEELNMLEETITVYNTKSTRTLRYNYNLSTRFLNKYGSESSALNFIPGTAVLLGEKTKTNVLSEIRMSDKVWVQTDVRKYTVNQAEKKLIIGKDEYLYSDKTCVYAGNDPVTMGVIGENDNLKVVGIDNNILSVAIMTGHGYIQFVNTYGFDGTMVQIGEKIFSKVTSEMLVEVPEGNYDVTVANNGYGGTINCNVVRDEITVVDLAGFEKIGLKNCQLTFFVTVPGTTVYIDGVQVNANEELTVPYGARKVVINAPGYNIWSKTVYVNSPKAMIAVELTNESSQTNNSNNTTKNSNTNTSESTNTSGSTGKSTSDAELDYLSTVSDMIGKLMGTSSGE